LSPARWVDGGRSVKLDVGAWLVTNDAHDECPANVKAFVATHIDSVVQLEVLLLLFGAPDRAWTADQIARELRIDPAWVQTQLEQLCTRGLLHCEAGEAPSAYQYRPHSPQLYDAVAGLAKAYVDRRVTVISLIYSKPPAPPPSATPAEPGTSDPLKSFADAFRLRKDNRNG
jgi:hypothetical protein